MANILPPPQNVLVQEGNGQILVTWDLLPLPTGAQGVLSYSVYGSENGVTWDQGSSIDYATNFYYVTSLDYGAGPVPIVVGHKYWFKVAAISYNAQLDAYLTGVFSTPQSVIPAPTAEDALGTLRLMAQQRADMVGSNFVSLTEWNSYINQSYFELYDLITTDYEDYYLAAPLTITTDGTTSTYPLPNGTNYSNAAPFYKLVGVDCGLNTANNAWITLNKFNFIDRNKFVFPNIGSSFLGVFNLQYRLMGNNIMFIPTPSANQILRVWYQPRQKQLLADTDIADGVSGWTEYIIVDAAIKALQKEESDVSALMMQKMALIKRIEESAMNRDTGQASTVSDTRSSNRWGGGGYGDGGNQGGW